MSNDGFIQFGFGENDENIGRKSNRFKAEGGRTYRVSFAWWPTNPDGSLNLQATTPEFTGAKRVFIDNVGFVVNPDAAVARLSKDDPKLALGTILVVWPTDAAGNVNKSAFQNGEFRVQPWIFSQDKYQALVPHHGEFHFGSHDVKITCTDTKFQKMTFAMCAESLFQKILNNPQTQEFAAKMLAEIQLVAGSIKGEIGRPMTLQQVQEKLGQASPAGASFNPGPSTNPNAGANAASSADIDNLLDNLIG